MACLLVTLDSVSVPGQRAQRSHRRHHDSFALLFAAILLDLSHIPANLLSLGALDFGMVVDGSVVMVENILRQRQYGRRQEDIMEMIARGAHEVQRPVFFARIIIIVSYLPIFTLQRVEGRSSVRWRGPWRLLCRERCCLRSSSLPCCAVALQRRN